MLLRCIVVVSFQMMNYLYILFLIVNLTPSAWKCCPSCG